jgi:hypothetical protein
MPLSPGDNTIRVASVKTGVQGIYDVYQFNTVNLKGEIHGFCYAVPAGCKPGQLVRDLQELHKRKLWFIVYLKDNGRMLQIHTIKEPRPPQNELWHIAQKVFPQTPREYKRLTNENLVTLN